LIQGWTQVGQREPGRHDPAFFAPMAMTMQMQ
jgi:hypothetical protein